MSTTAFISHRDCWLHDMGTHHPECPPRLDAINDQIIASGVGNYLSYHDAPQATVEQLIRAHPYSYIEKFQQSIPQQGIVHVDPDTAVGPHTYKAALRSAGAGVLATDLVVSGEAENAFCCVRPPGHHAERAKSMGFCFFNNIAVAARHAVVHHGFERVLIVDFDVHHGNGTEEILAGDPQIMMVGTFQHPFYPYCGTENPASNMLNFPLKAGTRGDVFRAVVEEQWMPPIERYRPQIIFISAGFDAHYEDDMGSMGLVEADYAWVTERLKEVAAKHSGSRIVSMLEGGYSLSALGRSVVAHLRVLADL